jgi:hypothetical protein
MGRPALEEKLNRELTSNEEMTEARVVYVLVAVRKLMEIGSEAATYPRLAFHCDWALHSRLTRNPEAIRVVGLFDNLEKARETGTAAEVETATRALDVITDAKHFRDEFRAFLDAHKLPTELCDWSKRWIPFLALYGQVISDAPLKIGAPVGRVAKVLVKHISESTTPDPPGWRFIFGLEWTPMRFDQKQGRQHYIGFCVVDSADGEIAQPSVQ